MKRILVVALLLLAITTSAQPPRTMNFQGTLADGVGTPLPNGSYNLTFRIWDTDIGGMSLWAEAISVDLSGGVFSTILGEVAPLNLPFDQAYWLGIAVEAEPELSPRSPLTGMPYAMNVADGVVVKSLNGSTDHLNLMAGSNITINTAGPNITISATGAVADGDWAINGNDMVSIPIGNVGISEAAPDAKLHVGGDLMVGNASSAGEVIAHNGAGYVSRFGGDYLSLGSELLMLDESNYRHTGSQPDYDDTGGFFWVQNGLHGDALRVDGNYDGTTHPRISMWGLSTVFFNLDQTNNNAVQLPQNSLAAHEILDEPGLATRSDHGTSSYIVQDSYSVVTSRTITVPEDGFLLAMASYEIDLRHEAPGASFVTAGLSLSSSTLPNNQDLSYYMPSVVSAGIYLTPCTPTAVFEVEAGSHTVHILACKSGTSVSYIWDAQLNVVFFPTAYGTVAESSGIDLADQVTNNQVSPLSTSADMAQERSQSIRDNEERMARELATLRAEVDAMKLEMQNRNGSPATREQ